MRKLLVITTLLLVSSAFAANVYEDSMDVAPGGWGSDLASVTEGGRTFTRAYNFWTDDPAPWFYCNKYAGGEVDISSAVRFECDIRFHQVGTSAYSNAWLLVRLGTPGYGEYFFDPIIQIGVTPEGSVGDTWYHVGFDLSLADATMDRTRFDGFEFQGTFEDDEPLLDYVDMDNVVFTPEPASLLLLSLLTVLRRR